MKKAGNPKIAKLGKKTQFKRGQSGNPKGRALGSKNLATIVEELESESFDWKHVPIKQGDLAKVKVIGAPWRAIVYTAVAQSLVGNVKAMEWLRKSGYGDKLDVTTGGQRLTRPPLIVSDIKPRKNANTKGKTRASS